MKETLGNLLATELGRRGQSGIYFDYDGYQALPSIDSVEGMQDFLDSNGYDLVLSKCDASWLADGLAEATEFKTPPWWATIDVVAIITLPVWLLTRFLAKKRTFPRRKKV